MPTWNSYRGVYGAELRAAAREFTDHGWPVVEESRQHADAGHRAHVGRCSRSPQRSARGICAQLRAAGVVVPGRRARPTGAWWYPVTPGAELPAALRGVAGVVLHSAGATDRSPRRRRCPTAGCTGGCRPGVTGYRLPAANLILSAAATAFGGAGRRRRTSGRPAARRCGRRRHAVLERDRGPGVPAPPPAAAARRAAPRAPGTPGCGAARGHFPRAARPHPERGRGRWITTDPGQYQLDPARREPNVVFSDGGNTRETTRAPAGSALAAWSGRPHDLRPTSGHRHSVRRALWVRDDLADPPIGRQRAAEHRRNTPVVDSGWASVGWMPPPGRKTCAR